MVVDLGNLGLGLGLGVGLGLGLGLVTTQLLHSRIVFQKLGLALRVRLRVWFLG